MSIKNIQSEESFAKRLVGPQRYGVAPTSLVIEEKKIAPRQRVKNTAFYNFK